MRNPFGADKLVRKRNMFGLVFLIPWLIGFLLFFCTPLIRAVVISFQTVSYTHLDVYKRQKFSSRSTPVRIPERCWNGCGR